MLKNIGFSALIAAVVVFSGCSQKNVEVSEENSQAQTKSQSQAQNESSSVQSEVQSQESNSAQTAESKKVATERKKAPNLNNIYFDFDKYAIRSNMRSVLKTNYQRLEKTGYDRTITLEGHCDERGSNEYNFALGLKRAQSVKNELVEYGVNPSQIKIISFGENKPLCTKQHERCWSKNRRVESILEK